MLSLIVRSGYEDFIDLQELQVNFGEETSLPRLIYHNYLTFGKKFNLGILKNLLLYRRGFNYKGVKSVLRRKYFNDVNMILVLDYRKGISCIERKELTKNFEDSDIYSEIGSFTCELSDVISFFVYENNYDHGVDNPSVIKKVVFNYEKIKEEEESSSKPHPLMNFLVKVKEGFTKNEVKVNKVKRACEKKIKEFNKEMLPYEMKLEEMRNKMGGSLISDIPLRTKYNRLILSDKTRNEISYTRDFFKKIKRSTMSEIENISNLSRKHHVLKSRNPGFKETHPEIVRLRRGIVTSLKNIRRDDPKFKFGVEREIKLKKDEIAYYDLQIESKGDSIKNMEDMIDVNAESDFDKSFNDFYRSQIEELTGTRAELISIKNDKVEMLEYYRNQYKDLNFILDISASRFLFQYKNPILIGPDLKEVVLTDVEREMCYTIGEEILNASESDTKDRELMSQDLKDILKKIKEDVCSLEDEIGVKMASILSKNIMPKYEDFDDEVDRMIELRNRVHHEVNKEGYIALQEDLLLTNEQQWDLEDIEIYLVSKEYSYRYNLMKIDCGLSGFTYCKQNLDIMEKLGVSRSLHPKRWESEVYKLHEEEFKEVISSFERYCRIFSYYTGLNATTQLSGQYNDQIMELTVNDSKDMMDLTENERRYVKRKLNLFNNHIGDTEVGGWMANLYKIFLEFKKMKIKHIDDCRSLMRQAYPEEFGNTWAEVLKQNPRRLSPRNISLERKDIYEKKIKEQEGLLKPIKEQRDSLRNSLSFIKDLQHSIKSGDYVQYPKISAKQNNMRRQKKSVQEEINDGFKKGKIAKTFRQIQKRCIELSNKFSCLEDSEEFLNNVEQVSNEFIRSTVTSSFFKDIKLYRQRRKNDQVTKRVLEMGSVWETETVERLYLKRDIANRSTTYRKYKLKNYAETIKLLITMYSLKIRPFREFREFTGLKKCQFNFIKDRSFKIVEELMKQNKFMKIS